MFLDASQGASDFLLNQGLKMTLENSSVANTMKGASLTLAGFSGIVGWSIGGFAGGLAGGLTGSFVGAGIGSVTGAGIGYNLAYKVGNESLAPFGSMAGTLVGTPVGFGIGSFWGITIGSWTGSALGAATAFIGIHALAPRLAVHASKSFAKTTQQELKGQLQLLVDYYIHRFLPLTPEEQALYYLNPNPTTEERAIYHEDYARRDLLISQSFVGEAIKQFIDLNGNSLTLTLNGIAEQYQKFVNYCLASSDATTEEILEKAGLTEDASSQVQKDTPDRIWRELVIRTSSSDAVTEQDKILRENLVKFPSFRVRQTYLEQLSLFMNSLSAKNLKEFAEDFSKRKGSRETEEATIQKIYETIQGAGDRIAELYDKGTGKPLDDTAIELVRKSAENLWKTATATQLDRLVELLGDNDFIQQYFSKDIEAVIDEDTDYLKAILDDYTSERDKVYLEKDNNQFRFEVLKKSSLVETLEDTDIVDLLRKIGEIGEEKLPDPIKDLMKDENSSERFVSLVAEKELNLVKEKYESLLGRQLSVLFVRAFQKQFENTAQEIGKKILEQKIQNITENQLSGDVLEELKKNESFRKFLGNIGSHPKENLFSNQTFSEIKGHIQKVAKDLINEKETIADGFQIIDSQPTEKTTSPSAEVEIKELKLYDAYDVGGFKLVEIIHKLSGNHQPFQNKDLANLDDNDFEVIYEEIQKEKKNSIICKSDIEFLDKYYGEMMKFKLSKINLENKLFYGYNDIIQDIRQQNQQILASIQNLKK